MNKEEIIEEFQCPGCVVGSSTNCEHYEFRETGGWFTCIAHTPGTTMIPGGTFCLGVPKGFNKISPIQQEYNRQMSIKSGKNCDAIMPYLRFYLETPEYDNYNVPVWAIEKDGFLFLRVYIPRLGLQYVDIIKNGKLEMVPNAIDINSFLDDMD